MGDGVTDRNSFQEPPKVHRAACDFVNKATPNSCTTFQVLCLQDKSFGCHNGSISYQTRDPVPLFYRTSSTELIVSFTLSASVAAARYTTISKVGLLLCYIEIMHFLDAFNTSLINSFAGGKILRHDVTIEKHKTICAASLVFDFTVTAATTKQRRSRMFGSR